MKVVRPHFPKRTILYYPTIDVPNTSWLRHAVLYWDEVSSIVPKDYEGNPFNELSAEVLFLISEGEFNPVRPEDLMVNWEALQKFESEFLGIVNNPLYTIFVRQNIYGASKGWEEMRHWSRIHRNKTSDTLYNSMLEKGLAKERDQSEWYYFETNTALLYMSLLAKHLAEVQSSFTSISTDYAVYEAFNFKHVSATHGQPVVNFNLNRLLPVPVDNIPLEKILDFKRHRHDNLLRFRRTILECQEKISNAESNKHIKDIIADFQEQMTIGVNDLRRAMKSSKINSRMKSLRSLMSLSKYPALAVAGDYAERQFHLPPQSLSVPITAGTGMIELGLNFIEKRIESSDKLHESAFSYVYEAKKAGIIKG